MSCVAVFLHYAEAEDNCFVALARHVQTACVFNGKTRRLDVDFRLRQSDVRAFFFKIILHLSAKLDAVTLRILVVVVACLFEFGIFFGAFEEEIRLFALQNASERFKARGDFFILALVVFFNVNVGDLSVFDTANIYLMAVIVYVFVRLSQER